MNINPINFVNIAWSSGITGIAAPIITNSCHRTGPLWDLEILSNSTLSPNVSSTQCAVITYRMSVFLISYDW